jgi:phosphoribosylaminoimidazolecarboxamide formyltransferase/IMP cyclohydrolase
MSNYITIKKALISCWDKTGLLEIGNILYQNGIEIISTDGTAKFFIDHHIPVTKVEDVTGFKTILDGRVKSLHPLIHGAILAKRTPEHLHQLKENGIEPIDLVIINLYPFIDRLHKDKSDLKQMVELIDIGGPAMLRAAAKNFENVVVLHHPGEYKEFIKTWNENNHIIPISYSQKKAADIFFYTAFYDSQISSYLDSQISNHSLPPRFSHFYIKEKDLRYGENPHQNAALYEFFYNNRETKSTIEQLWGKEMSYNNYVDASAAAMLVHEFQEPAIGIIKHTNPCGMAVDKKLAYAFQKALAGDPVSAYGGIIASNRTIDEKTAALIGKTFFECIIATDFSPEALKILQEKKNLRLLKMDFSLLDFQDFEYRFLPIGLLSQHQDKMIMDKKVLRIVSAREPDAQETKDLIFAWKVVKHVKSNAIVYAKNGQVVGVGAGQMSRVDSVKLAGQKAQQFGHELKGAVMASDAFFPFRDGVDEAARTGISAVIQPGGSKRDKEVCEAIDENNMAMLFTGIRHFKH